MHTPRDLVRLGLYTNNALYAVMAMMGPDLPDMTPCKVDYNIKSFVPKLCCTVNPVAIVYRKQVCQQCFEALRAQYSYPEWNLGGGSA